MMLNRLRIGTWNVCLGIANKKDLITESLNREGIDVCCVQETEIPQGYPEETLNCNKYVLELELNNYKKRTGIYSGERVKYLRRRDLERKNMHIVIVDILGKKLTRIISLYRSFRPLDLTPRAFFEAQLEILTKAQCSSCYILGDFNLEARMDSRPDYDRKIPLAQLSDFAIQNNFLQIVDFDTWSRVINGIRKESLIDHIYVNDISSVHNLKS